MSRSLAFSYTEVPVANLLKVVNPFEKPPWYCKPFSVEDVLKAVEEERFQARPVPNWYPREDQIERIAYLVEYGWNQDDTDVPAIDMNETDWPLGDGNHRLCAAVVRGDTLIKVLIEGDLALAEALFDFKIPDHQRFCED